MTEKAPVTHLASLSAIVGISPRSTVSRTVLKGDDVNLVVFAFDQGEELSEHTAAMPVLLQTLDGRLEVTADGRTVTLVAGDVMHLGARVPHSVTAVEPSRMLLTMITAART